MPSGTPCRVGHCAACDTMPGGYSAGGGTKSLPIAMQSAKRVRSRSMQSLSSAGCSRSHHRSPSAVQPLHSARRARHVACRMSLRRRATHVVCRLGSDGHRAPTLPCSTRARASQQGITAPCATCTMHRTAGAPLRSRAPCSRGQRTDLQLLQLLQHGRLLRGRPRVLRQDPQQHVPNSTPCLPSAQVSLLVSTAQEH